MPLPHDTLDDTRTLLGRAEAFLLDYNGTLSNDEELCAELISKVAEEHLGVTVSRERYYADFAGVKEEAVYGQLSAEVGYSDLTPHELMGEFNRHYLARFSEVCTITPDAQEFVKRAHRLDKRIMLVTAASRDVVVPALEIAGISAYFEGVIGLEDVTETKPEPECYLRAVEMLGVDASRVVAFEDSRTGLRAALGAELAAVGIVGTVAYEELRDFTPHVITGLHPDILGAAQS